MKNTTQQRIHISWHIAWLSGGIVLGIALAGMLHVRSLGLEALFVAIALFAGACLRPQKTMVIASVVAGLALGSWRGAAQQDALAGYAPYIGRAVQLSGTVSDDVSYGQAGDVRMELAQVTLDNRPQPGKVWVSVAQKHDIQRSDRVTVSGTLSKGFGNIPASMKRAALTITERPHPGDIALHVRDWFAGGIRLAIPNPQAALGIGYLVGQHAAMPQTLTDQIKIVGLTHAVVASGYNLTILVGFARQSLLHVSKFLATLSGGLMIAAFIMVTGLSPSMTRAGLVTGLSLLAWYYGRKLSPLVLLPFAAAITAFINPAYVWGDIGWMLSFTSFAGVLLLAPLIHEYFWGNAKPNAIRQILIETTSAQIATMPVILFAFGQFASYALLANMLVLPFIPVTMALTFGAGVASLAIPHFAHLTGWPATFILRYMTGVISWVARLPGSSSQIHFNITALIGSYASILAFGFYMRHKTRYSFRQAPIITIGEKI